MKKRPQLPKVAEVVRQWMPDASEEELEEAMKKEHRTRSELVREALRIYFKTL